MDSLLVIYIWSSVITLYNIIIISKGTKVTVTGFIIYILSATLPIVNTVLAIKYFLANRKSDI